MLETIKEYSKLSRSFNMALTGSAPLIGAIAMGEESFPRLFILFLLGCFAHIYGFVMNDYIDFKIDKLSKELNERPLVSGKISREDAFLFFTFALTLVVLLGIFLLVSQSRETKYIFISLLVLFSAIISAGIYNFISKKFPGMDIFVALSIFFIVLFGSTTTENFAEKISFSPLAYFVAFLCFLQVLFMNIVAGGLKDIEHDFLGNANTVAVKVGVRVENGNLNISKNFKTIAYTIEFLHVGFTFLALFYIFKMKQYFSIYAFYSSLILLLISALLMFFISFKFLNMKKFVRDELRNKLGIHYAINFALVPIMLSAFYPLAILIAFIPPLGFAIANKLTFGTVVAKTM